MKSNSIPVIKWIFSLIIIINRYSKYFVKAKLISEFLKESPSGNFFNPCPGHSTGYGGELFMNLIDTLITSECLLSAPCTYPSDVGGQCLDEITFDFIIVGGGTAGSVVASRLSEISTFNILLIEAGGDPTVTSDVPVFYQSLQKSSINWQYNTEKDPGLYNGFRGNINKWPRGKALGGTSSINTMLYMRGNRRDYDNWAGKGMFGWSYDEVLPYFKQSENIRDKDILNNKITINTHGSNGPLSISRFGGSSSVIDLLKNVRRDLKFADNIDLSISQLGFTTPNQGTIRGGERLNTAKAFLNPVKDRKNLFVIKHGYVTKINFDIKNKQTIGISYYWKKEKILRNLKAKREIIISAGTIETVKLLMLSGIGPKNHLQFFNISLIQDLPVGRNMQDHVMFIGSPITLKNLSKSITPLEKLDASYEYLTRRTGPFSNIGVSEVVGFIKVDPDDLADIQINFIYSPTNDTEILLNFLDGVGVSEEVYLAYKKMLDKHDVLLPLIILLHPLSYGNITLKSIDLLDHPKINPKYFTDPQDLYTMLEGIKFIEKMVETESMKKFGAKIEEVKLKGCCNLKFKSDSYWACLISYLAGTGWDPVGTARMGSPKDSVVDERLRVYGVKRLRVIDASIMPEIITGNILGATVMIGEKGADMIKEDWLKEAYKSNVIKNIPV